MVAQREEFISMRERTLFILLFLLSLLFLVTEITLAINYGLRLDLMFFPFLLAVGIGSLFFFGSLLLSQTTATIESVSTRRARQKKVEGLQQRLQGYDIDEEFIAGSRPGSVATAQAAEPAGMGATESLLDSYDMEQESFNEYIRRSMGADTGAQSQPDGSIAVDLDGESLSHGINAPPAGFSHDPKSVIESLKRAGGLSS